MTLLLLLLPKTVQKEFNSFSLFMFYLSAILVENTQSNVDKKAHFLQR